MSSNGDCTAPPRNIRYSDRFYQAQRFYTKSSVQVSEGVSAIIDAIPIVGSLDVGTDSISDTNLTEQSAREYFEKELNDYRAQIVAEAMYALCKTNQSDAIGSADFNMTQKTEAYDAIYKIVSLAFGEPTLASGGSNKPFGGNILPEHRMNRVVFTPGGKNSSTFKLYNIGTASYGIELGDLGEDLTYDSDKTFTMEPTDSEEIEIGITNNEFPPPAVIRNITLRNKFAPDQVIKLSVVIVKSSDYLLPPPYIYDPSLSVDTMFTHSKEGTNERGSGDSNGTFPLPEGSRTLADGIGECGQSDIAIITKSDKNNNDNRFSVTFRYSDDIMLLGGVGNVGRSFKGSRALQFKLFLPNHTSTKGWGARLILMANSDVHGIEVRITQQDGTYSFQKPINLSNSTAPTDLDIPSGLYKIEMAFDEECGRVGQPGQGRWTPTFDLEVNLTER